MGDGSWRCWPYLCNFWAFELMAKRDAGSLYMLQNLKTPILINVAYFTQRGRWAQPNLV
jgi:hypothetical protein